MNNYTVLWKKPRIGYEEVLPPAKRVWLRDKAQDNDPPACLGIEFTDKEIVMYDNGDFYVMNENGKTVAQYHLGFLTVQADSMPSQYPEGGTVVRVNPE